MADWIAFKFSCRFSVFAISSDISRKRLTNSSFCSSICSASSRFCFNPPNSILVSWSSFSKVAQLSSATRNRRSSSSFSDCNSGWTSSWALEISDSLACFWASRNSCSSSSFSDCNSRLTASCSLTEPNSPISACNYIWMHPTQIIMITDQISTQQRKKIIHIGPQHYPNEEFIRLHLLLVNISTIAYLISTHWYVPLLRILYEPREPPWPVRAIELADR